MVIAGRPMVGRRRGTCVTDGLSRARFERSRFGDPKPVYRSCVRISGENARVGTTGERVRHSDRDSFADDCFYSNRFKGRVVIDRMFEGQRFRAPLSHVWYDPPLPGKRNGKRWKRNGEDTIDSTAAAAAAGR